MKGFKKCSGLLLVLFIIFGLSLSVSCEDSSALSHEYDGIIYTSLNVPIPSQLNNTNEYYLNWNSTNPGTSVGSGGITLEFKGDAYTNYESDLTFRSGINYSALNTIAYSDGTCYYDSGTSLVSIFERNSTNSSLVFKPRSNYGFNLNAPEWTGILNSRSGCNYRGPFGTQGSPSFNWQSVPHDMSTCDVFSNGCNQSGLATLFVDTWVDDHMRPYHYTSDGFYLHSTAIDTDTGVHYNNTFSFSQMFNKPIQRFSKLQLSLGSYSNYFYNPDNLYHGREIEFKGAFEFDGSFAWHSGIEQTGKFVVHLHGYPRYTNYLEPYTQEIPCTINNRTVPDLGVNWLEYSCKGFYDVDYVLVSASLEISNQDNYVFVTDDDWRFASVFLVTDNDDTPGESFNSNLTGGDTILGQSIVPSSDENWFSSLTNLFGFNFINPFAPIFNLFTDQTSCAKIPTLAGMIHSETDEVCPWFDSGTRNIVTPVLSLASMMLVFGFVVRWLGSSSGNLFEDSTNETISNVNHSGFRRYKK